MNNQAFSKIWILVIIVIILAGGILVWQYLRVPKEEGRVPEELVKEEIADWKTYRNEKMGFEIKYPSKITLLSDLKGIASPSSDVPNKEFIIKAGTPISLILKEYECDVLFCADIEISDPDVSYTLYEFGNPSRPKKVHAITSPLDFLITIREKPSDFIDLDTYAKEIEDALEHATYGGVRDPNVEVIIKELTIGNKRALLLEQEESVVNVLRSNIIIFEKSNYLFEIVYLVPFSGFSELSASNIKDRETIYNLIQKILSTFRFLE